MTTKTQPKKPIDTAIPLAKINIERQSNGCAGILQLLGIDQNRERELANDTVSSLEGIMTWYAATIARLPDKPRAPHLRAEADQVLKRAESLAEVLSPASLTPELMSALGTHGVDLLNLPSFRDTIESLAIAAREVIATNATVKGDGGALNQRIAAEVGALKGALEGFYVENCKAQPSEDDKQYFVEDCLALIPNLPQTRAKT